MVKVLKRVEKLGGKMYLIVGLGNPEPEYSKTRHNMGFDINKLAKQYEIELSRSNFEGIYGTGIIENEKVILLKPQTYMNLSGQSIKKYIDFYKIPLENILVVFDDMDIGSQLLIQVLKLTSVNSPFIIFRVFSHNSLSSVSI